MSFDSTNIKFKYGNAHYVTLVCLKGEFKVFWHIFFFFPQLLVNQTPRIAKNSKVPDRSFGVLEIAHRGPKFRWATFWKALRDCNKQNSPQGPQNTEQFKKVSPLVGE